MSGVRLSVETFHISHLYPLGLYGVCMEYMCHSNFNDSWFKKTFCAKKNDLIIIFIMREYKYVYFQIYYLIEQTHTKYKYTYIQNMSNKNR